MSRCSWPLGGHPCDQLAELYHSWLRERRNRPWYVLVSYNSCKFDYPWTCSGFAHCSAVGKNFLECSVGRPNLVLRRRHWQNRCKRFPPSFFNYFGVFHSSSRRIAHNCDESFSQRGETTHEQHCSEFVHIFDQAQSYSQPQCALLIATFIGKALKHRELLLTCTRTTWNVIFLVS